MDVKSITKLNGDVLEIKDEAARADIKTLQGNHLYRHDEQWRFSIDQAPSVNPTTGDISGIWTTHMLMVQPYYDTTPAKNVDDRVVWNTLRNKWEDLGTSWKGVMSIPDSYNAFFQPSLYNITEPFIPMTFDFTVDGATIRKTIVDIKRSSRKVYMSFSDGSEVVWDSVKKTTLPTNTHGTLYAVMHIKKTIQLF